MTEIKKEKNKTMPKVYAFLVFLSLSGIYLMPEKIKVFVAIFVFGLFLYFVFYNAPFKFNKQNVAIIVYMLIGIISNIINKDIAFLTMINFVISIVIAILVLSINVDVYTAQCLTKAFVGVMCIVVLGCLLQLFFPSLLLKFNKLTLGEEKYFIFYDSFFQYDFLVGFSYQTGVTGYYLALLAGYFLSCVFANIDTTDIWKKIAYILGFAITFILLFLTAKRIEMIVIFLAFFVMLYLYERNRPAKVIGIIIAFIFAVLILLLTTEMGRRLIERTFGDNPTSGRSKIYSLVWSYFIRKPLFGNGFGSTIIYVKDFTNGHNIYLQSLMEAGIVGGIALIIALFKHAKIGLYVTKNIKKLDIKDKAISGFFLFVMLNFFVTGLLSNPLYDIYPLFGYAIAVSIMQAYSRSINKPGIQTREVLYGHN